MDGVKCSLFLNFANIYIYIYIYFFFTCLRSIQVILQLFFSVLTSEVCCLNIPLLLGEKDLLYLCNKVSVYYIYIYIYIFFWGGVLGFKATRFLVNSIFFRYLQKVREIIKKHHQIRLPAIYFNDIIIVM